MIIDPQKTEQLYRIPLGNGKFVRTAFTGHILESTSKKLIQGITLELNQLEEVGELRKEEFADGQISFDIPDPKDKTDPKVTLYTLCIGRNRMS